MATAQSTYSHEGRLSTANGLSDNTNSFVFKDSRGFIWISSLDGLNRFDGRTVKVYRQSESPGAGILGRMILSPFFEDKRGDIWFSTESAIHCYRRRLDRFQYYYAGGNGTSPPLSEYNIIFLDQQERLWLTTNDSLFTLHTSDPRQPAGFIAPLAKGVRFAVHTGSNGEVTALVNCFWDYGNGFEILYFNENQKVTNRQIHFTNHPGPALICRQVIADGIFCWIATDKGLLKFNTTNPSDYRLFAANAAEPSLQSVVLFDNNTVVVSSSAGSVFFFDKQTTTFSSYPPNEIPSRRTAWNALTTNVISVTADGAVWLGKYGEGIRFIHPGGYQFSNYPLENTPKDFVPTQLMTAQNGQVWCAGRDNRICYFSGGRWQTGTLPGRLPKFFSDAAGAACILSTAGISEMPEHLPFSGKQYGVHGLPFSEYYLVPSKSGHFFLGTNRGLFTLDTKSRTIEKEPSQNQFIGYLFSDHRDRIWIGDGAAGGTAIFNVSTGGLVKQAGLNHTGIVNQIIPDVSDYRFVWIAASNGLFRVNIETFENQIFNQQNCLPDNNISSVIQDKATSIWMSAGQAIIHFDLSKKQWRKYTPEDGLPGGAFCRNTVLKDSRGYLWFGGTKGVTVFHPDSITDIGHAPQLAITGLRIHDREWQGDTAIEMTRQIDLPYNQNTLRLQLAAMEYLSPGDNQFRVMLQSGDEPAGWTDLGTQNFVTYANLKPGRYTFRFIACNAEGIWVDEKNAQVLQINIHPHWTNTWWFRTLAAAFALMFAAAATAFFYRYRLRAKQLELEKAERERVKLEKNAAAADSLRKIAESEMKLLRSQLNPHFLFNAMNSINRYMLTNEKDKASEYLGQFAQLTRSILDNSRHLSISLADELKMLEQYLALESHRFEQQISWTIQISDEVDEEILLVPSMVLQPFAENAVLHGLAPKNGGHIQIDISRNGDHLQCRITDNGIGRQTGATGAKPRHASAGMRLINERIDAFAALEGQSATVEITDLKDAAGNPAGTSVVIQLPWVEAI